MALNPNFQLLFSFIIFLIIFLLYSPTSHAKIKNIPNDDKNSSPFDFKTYLKKFGYLIKHHNNDEYSDHTLESAIKTFQENFGLKLTGTLDAETISQMKAPRCGVPDIINGTNYMQPRPNNGTPESSSHYAFFSNNRVYKWDKFNLTYKLLGEDFPEFAKIPIEVALEKWANVSEFIFSEETRDFVGGDVNIGFYRGDHGDGYPFDGRGGVLAHSYAPSDGRLHFDLDEDWFRDYPKSLDSQSIDSVALHEIGHILGLGHSAEHAAVMYPTIRPRQIKIALDADDIEGIQELYDFD